jgi:hypothetical protein
MKKRAKTKRSKAVGKRRATPASPCRRYPFVNNEGKLIWIDGSATIPDLLRMGVKDISFAPLGSPMPTDKNIYVHAAT